ncbi:MAG: glycoside hydrolase family 9 protein [Ruminococcus sp.]|nr:glycoside hydrolase family 9 protein [Ruminococcus sp.]
MRKSKFLSQTAAGISAAAVMLSGIAVSSHAAVINKDKSNNYQNFAKALQLGLCFYDANKCGNEVSEDGYYSWRADCHVKDAEIPLQPMNPMPSVNKGKPVDDEKTDEDDDGRGEYNGEGDGGASAAEGLYIGVNMSEKFIAENKAYLDPDGNGYVDLTGGWHDAGDHVKFGLPGSYSASTLGWGYYEFPEAYRETGLDKHVEDELRWINDYFMKATFLDDDGKVIAYCYQVGEGNNDHNYWCPPELQVDGTVVASSSCAVKRPAYFATREMPASDQCAGAAASLAVNYMNFKEKDPEYAEKCLKYAVALYDFAVETHTEEWELGTTPTATSLGYDGGFYTSSYDYDELAWAAVWLYYCTENWDYIDDIIAVDETVSGEMGAHPYTGYMKRIITDTGNCWQNIWVHCWDTVWGGVFAKLAPVTNISRDWYIFRWNLEFWSGMSESDAAAADFDVPVTSHKYFGMDDQIWNTKITAAEIADLPEADGAWLKKTPAGFAMLNDYGSARYNTAAGLEAMVYAKETDDMTFAEWAKDQMEYILGNNPMGYAYEIGYENNFASQAHHRSSHCSPTQSMDDPAVQVHTLWGALVGGPDADDFHRDETKDFIYNEVTDDYNAAFCGDLAGLYHFYGAKGKELADKNYVIPDFDMSKNAAGYEQTDSDGNPIPTGLYISGGKSQETDAGIQVKIVVHNRTVNPPKFESNLKARYYFNISEQIEKGEDISFIETRTDYDQESSFTDGKNQALISEPVKYDDNGTYYIEISWQNCDFYGSRVYQFGLLNKMHPETYDTVWDSENDYSYSELISFEDDNDAAAITEKITLYADDKLVWGTEPDGTSASDETANPDNSGIHWGDTNCDGTVTVADATILLQYLGNKDKYKLSEQGKKNADVDGKDGLSAVDALIIQQVDAGIYKLTELPLKS